MAKDTQQWSYILKPEENSVDEIIVIF